MARINKRSLTVSLFGSEATNQLSEASIDADDVDSDFITFAEAAAGGARAYVLKATVVQDAATGTVWDKIWTAPGSSVACIYRPYGNATPTTAQPHYTFNCTVKEPNGTLLGGEADSDTTAYQTIEIEWPLDAKPTKVTA